MLSVLGVKLGPQHDTGACLIVEKGGELACTAIAEERLSRQKHSRVLPELSIRYCLDAHGLTLRDVSLIVIDTLGPTTLVGDVNPVSRIEQPGLYDDATRQFLAEAEAATDAVVLNHHLAHAASAYHVLGTDRAAILIVDGSGSAWPAHESPDRNIWVGPAGTIPDYRLRRSDRRRETQSVFLGRGRDLRRRAVSTLSGVGHFYTWVTERVVGFGHLQEGKLMGLAGWGDPEEARRWPRIDTSLFRGIDTPILDHLMDRQINPPLRTDRPPTDPFYAGLARWAQQTLEDAVDYLARYAIDLCGAADLCLAGGVGLNVVANRRIRENLDGSLFIQPAASDTGTPLGCALYGYYNLLGGRLPFQRELAYLGRRLDGAQAAVLLAAAGGRRSADVYRQTAAHLAANRIVGWCRGPSEYGPRALGNRSILCSPRQPWIKDHLNVEVKHREAFRPFAPIVREERAARFFDVDYPVPYMLINAIVRPEYREKLPAITHVDGSARLQTVNERQNPPMYRLLRAFEELDECGVLLNTSFNDAGEPIVETAQDALQCFLRTGLDVLVCEDAMLTKEQWRAHAPPTRPATPAHPHPCVGSGTA